jgi:prepilin-type N-terminal cleavage/methylation domain-containing protein
MKKAIGFTIVELLVVIVVIGILVSISLISYSGIQNRAVAASMFSDLNSASTQLKIDQVINDVYPDTLAAANAGKGISSSSGTTYQYAVNNVVPQTFCLTAINGSRSYNIDQTGAVLSGGRNYLPNSNPLNDSGVWRYVYGFSDNDIITVQIWGTGSVAIYKDNGWVGNGSLSAVSGYGVITLSVKPWTADPVHDNGSVLFVSSVVGKMKVEKGSNATCWTPY